MDVHGDRDVREQIPDHDIKVDSLVRSEAQGQIGKQHYAEITDLDDSIAAKNFENPYPPIHCELFFHIIQREQVVDEDPKERGTHIRNHFQQSFLH